MQTEWAVRYEHEGGLVRNYDRAVQLYCRAAWDGDVDAQYRLGWLYANDRGVERNDKLAAGGDRWPPPKGINTPNTCWTKWTLPSVTTLPAVIARTARK